MRHPEMEVVGRSIAKRVATPRRCGDHFVAASSRDGSLLVLAVSDGVSTSRNDALTSRTACEAFVDDFFERAGKPEERLEQAVLVSHDRVRDEPKCGLATLVAAVWERKSNQVFYASVGDSRIYRLAARELEKLTEDDRKAVPVRLGGKLHTAGGAVTTQTGLTRAIGQDGDLNVEVESIDLPAGALLVLASDGACELGRFTAALDTLQDSPELPRSLERWMFEGSRGFEHDDVTVLVFRWLPAEDALTQDVGSVVEEGADFRLRRLPGALVTCSVLRELLAAIDADDSERALRLATNLKSARLTTTAEREAEVTRRLESSGLSSNEQGRIWRILSSLVER